MRKSIKRFLIAFLAVVCVACAGAAAACKKEAEYFTLTYVAEDCVEIVSEASNGAQVKKDTEISFSLVIAEEAEGDPFVDVNGKELRPDAHGVYTFKMTENTTVTVMGVSLMSVYTVEFDKSYTVSDENGNEYTYYNDFIDYLDLEGNVLETAEVVSGNSISFKLHTSVYYGKSPEYTVTAGTSILTPDSNGVYTFSVAGDTKVKVTGLPVDLAEYSFAGRADGGKGTETDPYLIREPVDLYVMADLMEDEWYADLRWQTAYYKLANDIDMQGEQLYVIGNTLTSVGMFAGVFDGNGHTIKNYKMTNKIVEQSTFSDVYLPYVGLFGFTVSARIFNLNLANFTIEVDSIQSADNTFAGAVAGCARGSDIQNCSVNGKIIMHGSDASSFIGGIVGSLESYRDDESGLTASVQSCSTDVEIGVLSGTIYSAGGIAGYMYTADAMVTASILNCYATGDVYGAMRAGGIAGQVSSYSSIKNCYATGEIEADNYQAEFTGAADFSYAYAGGIAAYAEFGSIVSNSFFTGNTTASAQAGKRFEVTDGIVAGKDTVTDGILAKRNEDSSGNVTYSVYTDSTVVYKCYAKGDSGFSLNDSFLKSTLGWSDKDWSFVGGYPEINKKDADKKFSVTIRIDGKLVHTWEIDSYYASMGHWYSYSESFGEGSAQGIPEFLGSGSRRTYGYYFDEGLTVKVPNGYIPTDDIDIYAAYVDYTNVTGTYYLQGKTGYLELTDNGLLVYRDGALNVISTYVYNGEYAILNNTFFAILANPNNNDFHTFKAEIKDGVISIYDNGVYMQHTPLTASKKVDGFHYGSYFDAQNNEYTFNVDGTGFEKLANGSITEFTFTISETASGFGIEVEYRGNKRVCTVNADGVVTSFNHINLSVYDGFKGVWESSAGVNRQYSFDGKGNWTYKHYDYDKDGKEVIIVSENGTYTINNGVLTLDGSNLKVVFDGKFMSVGGETFYKENSFTGTWSFAGRPTNNEPIEITFKGISADGYGEAEVNYKRGGSVTVNYSATENNGRIYIVLYRYYVEWGLLTYDMQSNALVGNFYSNAQGQIINNVSFCLYDELKGEWNGVGAITSLEFDGLGRYDINGSVNCLETKGYVTVNGDEVRYTLDDGSLTGSFTYNSKTYTFEYDRENGTVTVVCGDESSTLTRKSA